jgi:hypothetical protein
MDDYKPIPRLELAMKNWQMGNSPQKRRRQLQSLIVEERRNFDRGELIIRDSMRKSIILKNLNRIKGVQSQIGRMPSETELVTPEDQLDS